MIERAHADTLLRQMLGADAQFRDGQWEAIQAIAERRERLLVVQRTGWGKSIVYFLATKLLRDSGAGPALLISPLLSLMRNQISMAERLGVRAATVHSENLAEWPEVEAALQSNRCDVLMVSPERLGNAEFFQKLLPLIQGQIGLFVVDEAHCISDWGHDFRPDYRRIVRLLRLLPPGVPVLCTTATANNRVVNDVLAQVPNLQVLRGPLIRRSLKLFNIKLRDQADRLAWLAHFVPRLKGSGVIYCLTVQDARRVAEWLQQKGIAAGQYHADLEAAEKIEAVQQLIDNQVKALVATVALGMGFDKPDLRFVIHFQRPGSVIAYYQQVGRAGRAVDEAYGILLSGGEDDEIQDYFIRTAFPPAEVIQEILRVLEGRAGTTLPNIARQTNQPWERVKKALKLLEVDGAVQHQGWVYSRTANPWTPDLVRSEQVTRLRWAELEQIQRYVEHTGCLMEFLAHALDDPSPARCGECMNCTGRMKRKSVPPELVEEAVEFLRSGRIVLEAHSRWPKTVCEAVRTVMPKAVRLTKEGRARVIIPKQFRAKEGRALSFYGDAGWGREVSLGKYETGTFSDTLVEAAARLVLERWKPQPPPQWVTAAPSLRHPELVRGFTERLAAKLGLPFVPVLRKTKETRPQKEMQDSARQIHNLLGAFDVVGEVPSGPLILVDDMVDSGWTLTLLAVVLQQHGSGPVHPLALAKSSPRSS